MSSTDLTPGIHNEPDIRLPKAKKVRRYVATLNQTGTNAPIANVIYNDLGVDVVYQWDAVGIYRIEATGALTVNKTVYFIGQSSGNCLNQVIDYGDLPNYLYIECINLNTLVGEDGQLNNAPLTIEVWDL